MIIKEVKVKSILTKSNLPLGGYSVNPYIGCSHACKYCYASFMKRFTNHPEEWGTFIDVKYWDKIKNPQKYSGKIVVLGSVTDPYNPQEKIYKRTLAFLEEMKDSGAEFVILTKSDLILRDLQLLKKLEKLIVGFSINTLDENFKNDMDKASSIEKRLKAMKILYNEGIKTGCFISPIFPEITNIENIFERVKNICDTIWLENLNLRGSFKSTILNYINEKYPQYSILYDEIYNKNDKNYFRQLEENIQLMTERNNCKYVNNKLLEEDNPKGHPAIVNFFYHEEVRGSENTGRRNK